MTRLLQFCRPKKWCGISLASTASDAKRSSSATCRAHAPLLHPWYSVKQLPGGRYAAADSKTEVAAALARPST